MFLTGYLELNKTLIKGIDYKSHYLVYALYQWYTNGQLQRKKKKQRKREANTKNTTSLNTERCSFKNSFLCAVLLEAGC